MRAKIVAPITIDADDRTVQPTIELWDDQGNLIQTTTDILIPIDGISVNAVVERLRDLIQVSIKEASVIPLSQAQINTMLLGIVVVVPD